MIQYSLQCNILRSFKFRVANFKIHMSKQKGVNEAK